jgi:adenosine/AMP kinase
VNTEVIRAWIEANLRSIVQEGMKCLQLSAEDGYFKKAALEAAMEIANSSSMIVFKQRFWPRYLKMLKDNERPIPVMTISEEGGNPVVVIISYEEVPANEEAKVEAA